MSAKNTYNKILTGFLVIMGIILVGIAGYAIYDFISAKMINNESEEFISEFENEMNVVDSEIITDENVDTNQTTTDNTSGSSKSSKVSSSRSKKKKKSTKKYYSYDICGYIRIPKTGIKYPIIADYSRNALEKGICLEYGPGPNEPGNTVLAGHNYLNRLFFSKNKNLKKGDKIYITDVYGVTVEYEIYKKFETSPKDTSYYFRDTKGEPELTLATCSKNGSKRLILYAK